MTIWNQEGECSHTLPFVFDSRWMPEFAEGPVGMGMALISLWATGQRHSRTDMGVLRMPTSTVKLENRTSSIGLYFGIRFVLNFG
jgi:hypothetical protein